MYPGSKFYRSVPICFSEDVSPLSLFRVPRAGASSSLEMRANGLTHWKEGPTAVFLHPVHFDPSAGLRPLLTFVDFDRFSLSSSQSIICSRSRIDRNPSDR